MKSNSDKGILPGCENSGTNDTISASDIKSADPVIQDIEENKYYFLIKKGPNPAQPYISMENGKKKKYNGSSNMADTVFDTSSVPIDYADYLSMPILEEDAKAMHIFQERVSTFLVDYYNSDTNNQNLNYMSNVEKDKTKDVSDEPGTESSELTKENQKKVNEIVENISTSIEDIMEGFSNDSFLLLSTKNLEEFNSHLLSSSSNESAVYDNTLGYLKIIDISLRPHKSIVTLIKDNDGLMDELNKSLVTLTEKSELSPVEEKVLTKIISIFWQILKSGGKISNSKDMEKCFKHPKFVSSIKIGAALCLSYLMDSSCPLDMELHSYLKRVYTHNPNRDIFSLEDILMALGKISLKQNSDLKYSYIAGENNPNIKEDVQIHNVNVIEKIAEDESVIQPQTCNDVSKEEYRDVVLLLTKDHTLKEYPDFVRCIKAALRMGKPEIVLNIIHNSHSSINFGTEHDILERLLQFDHYEAILCALNRGVVSHKDHGILLKIAQRYPNMDVVSIVSDKIKPKVGGSEVNLQLLTASSDCLSHREIRLFKMYIGFCECVDEVLEDGDTLLTRVIKNLDAARLEEVLRVRDFDINLHNKDGEAPIVLACMKQVSEKKLEALVENSKKTKIMFTGEDCVSAIEVLDKTNKDLHGRFRKILTACLRPV